MCTFLCIYVLYVCVYMHMYMCVHICMVACVCVETTESSWKGGRSWAQVPGGPQEQGKGFWSLQLSGVVFTPLLQCHLERDCLK